MARDLSGKRVAILATDGVERIELEQPRGALYGAGAETELLSIHPGEIQARQFDLVSAGTFSVDAYHCGRRQGPPAHRVAQPAR
jgi:protease I